jgi:hypothetical protein
MAEDWSNEVFGDHRLTPACSTDSLDCPAAFLDQVADTGPIIAKYTGFINPPGRWIQWAIEALVRSPVHIKFQRHRAF